MLFDKETYTARRDRLKRQVKEGLILLFGNNDAPSNYPANVYKYRQDSSFLYFYGQHREGLVGVIDIDNHKEYLIGNDIDIEDIVWFGAVDSVADLAAQSGVEHSAPMNRLEELDGKSEQISMEKFRMYLLMDNQEQAFNEIESLSKEYPYDLRYQTILGDVYLNNDKLEEAYAVYQRILKEEPGYAPALHRGRPSARSGAS